MNRRGGRCGGDGGQSSVELALALPLVALLLLAVVQVGLVGRGRVLVTHAAREAARAAAVGEDHAGVVRAARDAGGLDGARLEVEVTAVADRVRVRVRYAQPTDVALVGPLVGDIVLEAEATMRREDLDG